MAAHRGSLVEIFTTFLRLGLSSFGGPIAHLGYFRRELVERRQWVSDAQYAQLLAISQFLPGPASSQLGFSLGLMRGGWAGALAAFLGFTLPSAALMFAFAIFLPQTSGEFGGAALQGLKIVALVVVAHGVIGMRGRLCPDPPRMTIAALAAVVILLTASAWVQLLVVVLGAVAGQFVGPDPGRGESIDLHPGYGTRAGAVLLGLFGAILLGLPAIAHGGTLLLADAFYRAGALVFGGGHVVLPLLEEMVAAPGWISQDAFLSGYGAAQAVPGPMFSLSAYLGASVDVGVSAWSGSVVALVAIFLPGFLLMGGVLPFWRALAARPRAARAIAGTNAAVVGLLAAALYDPVFTSAVRVPVDLAIGIVGFTLLAAWRVSALVVVFWCVLARVAWQLA